MVSEWKEHQPLRRARAGDLAPDPQTDERRSDGPAASLSSARGQPLQGLLNVAFQAARLAVGGLVEGKPLTWTDRRSPAMKLTGVALLGATQVVATSLMEQNTGVGPPFLRSLNVQLFPRPGAPSTPARKFEAVPASGRGV
jgi:hypothetical protein